VTAIDPQGVSLDLAVEMTNPNGYTLAVQNVSGRVVLENGTDLGEVVVSQALSLPPNEKMLVKVPLTARWNGVASLAATALSGKDIPFTVTGKVGVGSEKLSIDVPFAIAGVLTRAELERSLTNQLGKLRLPLPVGSALPLGPR
jgi:LEA14-like dessication related protein